MYRSFNGYRSETCIIHFFEADFESWELKGEVRTVCGECVCVFGCDV